MINENAKNEDSTIKMNKITKDETMEQMPQLRIVNIVSMVDLGCDLIFYFSINFTYFPKRKNHLFRCS